MVERNLKEHLQKVVKRYKGEARKVRWEGRNFAPDWLVLTPVHHPFLVELKDIDKEPTVMQQREINLLNSFGFRAEWANSEFMLGFLFEKHRKVK